MDKSIIKVYVASVSEQLAGDRLEIGNLVRRLNDIYEPLGREVVMLEVDKLCSTEEQFRDINAKISQSDMFISLACKSVDRLTVSEIDLAHGEYLDDAQSKIHPYIKVSASTSEELSEFKDHLLKELTLNWSNYANSDTLKLNFVMQIQSIGGSLPVKLEVSDSTVKLAGESIADLEQIPFAANNERLISLKERYSGLNREIELLSVTLAAKENEQLRELYWRKCEERTEVKSALESLEKALFDTALLIASMHCIASSDRLHRAVLKFESGDYRGANEILDSKLIDADIDIAITMVQQGEQNIAEIQESVRVNIKEYLLKVNTTMIDFDNSDRFAQACSYHEMAIDAARRCELPLSEIIDNEVNYATFLITHKQFSRSAEIYERVLPLLLAEANPEADTLVNIVDIKINNGVNDFFSGNVDSARRAALEALELCDRLCDKGLQSESDLIEEYSLIHNNLGLIYVRKYEYDSAEEHHKKALSYRQKIAESNTTAQNLVAQSMDNLGLLYYDQERFPEAEKMFLDAYAIYEDIFKKTGHKFSSIIINQDSLGRLYAQQEQYDKAINAYYSALEYAEGIYEEFPERYKPELARVQNSLGKLMMMLGLVDLAKEQLLASLNHFFQMSRQEIRAYMDQVREVLNFLNENLEKYGRASEAEEVTLDILEQLSHDDKYSELRRVVYGCLGGTYLSIDNLDKAEEIFKQLIQSSKDSGEAPRVMDLTNIGSLYLKRGDYSLAKENYQVAMEYITSSDNRDKDGYLIASNYEIALVNYSLAYLYFKTDKFDEAIAYFNRSLELLKELMAKNPFDYSQFYARALLFLGCSYLQKEDGEAALDMLSESLALYLSFQESRHFAHKEFIIAIVERLNSMLSCDENQADLEEYLAKGVDDSFKVENADGQGHDLTIPVYFEMATRCLHNAAIHYHKVSNLSKLEHIGAKAVDQYTRLYMVDPSKYLEYLITVVELTCIAYEASGKFEKSEKLHELEVAVITARLSEDKSKELMLYYLCARNDLACCYAHLEKFREAIELLENNLEIYEVLARDNYALYKMDILSCEMNTESYYKSLKEFGKSKELSQKCIDKYIVLAAEQPNEYTQILHHFNLSITEAYLELGNLKETESHLLNVIEKIDKRDVDFHLANFERLLALLYIDMGEREEALRNFKISLKHFMQLDNIDQYQEFLEEVSNHVSMLSIELNGEDYLKSSANNLSLEELDEMLEREEYPQIIDRLASVSDRSSEESFYLAIALVRLGVLSKAFILFSALYKDQGSSEAIRFASMTNMLVILLLQKSIDHYLTIYNNLSQEDRDDEDIKEIHRAYEDSVAIKPKRSLLGRLFSKKDENSSSDKSSSTIAIKQPYGYMF